ncbi:MAG: M14 family zinc carboxypeptidase [Bacillota bacterium]|nr:M14 family zinc carboxypeptidase [Bacillota bacterium]
MYTYESLVWELKSERAWSAGKSVWGRELFCYTVGEGDKKLFLNGAHHGLEYITSKICVDFGNYIKNDTFGWKIFIMPMVNPDGVTAAQGLLPRNTETYDRLRRLNRWDDLHRTWQSNANGIDLNHNYDAKFHQLWERGPTRCSGPYPESEPETKAVAGLVRRERFDMVICLHSQGEVIYQGFDNYLPPISGEIAAKIAEISGYAIDEPEEAASFGGLKDWFVDKFDKPGFTIEVGRGTNPIAEECIPDIENRLFPALKGALLTYNDNL